MSKTQDCERNLSLVILIGLIRNLIETFRFKDEDEYSQSIDSPESFILPFSLDELSLLPFVKEVTPSRDRKMIKLLTFYNSIPPLRHSL